MTSFIPSLTTSQCLQLALNRLDRHQTDQITAFHAQCFQDYTDMHEAYDDGLIDKAELQEYLDGFWARDEQMSERFEKAHDQQRDQVKHSAHPLQAVRQIMESTASYVTRQQPDEAAPTITDVPFTLDL